MNKKYSYNTISFVVFATLIVGAFSFFTFADDSTTTLFEDFDRDGISNTEEETLGTDPKEADTDGDGYSDGVELESGYDPLIPAPNDRIINDDTTLIPKPENISTTNVTEKISEDVISFLADAQEEGKEDISPEELAEAVSKSVDDKVEFIELPTVTKEEISIKEQDYDNLSKDKEETKKREDAIEYFTAVSYIFISNFPQGFFDNSEEELMSEVLKHVNNYSASLSDYTFFEEIAQHAFEAEEQLDDVDVPEDLVELHLEGLELLRSAQAIYEAGDYKKVDTDIAPVLATLAQAEGLLLAAMDFEEHFEQKLIEYDLEDIFLQI